MGYYGFKKCRQSTSALNLPGTHPRERKRIASLKSQGLIRKVGPRLYASVPASELPSLIKNSWGIIVTNLYPNALISHLTALSYLPNSMGEVFLTSKVKRNIVLPGLTIKFMRGPGPDIDDVDFMGMKASSFERALLENLASARGEVSGRVLPIELLEERLEQILLRKGELELNKVRKRARQIARRLDMDLEFKRLDKMIGALLGTKPGDHLKSKAGFARHQGLPYDSNCLNRLEILFGHLRHLPIEEITEKGKRGKSFLHKAFFESYFSNYIEGTIFELSEAEKIVFDHAIPESRPIDAHDVLETFKIVSDPNEMHRTPETFSDLIEMIKSRHAKLFERRPEIAPGIFKKSRNRAGSSLFVEPDYVIGTLDSGFKLYRELPVGLARAIFLMFLVSDVHPFNDGNGRVSRIMMNAELYSKKLSTIIIPTVYREDYLTALKALTRRSNPDPYTRMILKAHSFSALDFSDYAQIKKRIKDDNWFEEPDDAKLIIKNS